MTTATILLVEDDGILAAHLEDVLNEFGYRVLPPVATGEEAIYTLQYHQADLVLMDIELAGELNGIETASIIKHSSDIPIVFLTSYSQEPLLEQAKTVTPYGYLIKPVPERELAATIDMSLHRHAMDRRLLESQKALAQSEAKYRRLFEDSPLGIFRTSLDGRLLLMNAEMARMIGWSSPENAVRELTDVARQLYVMPAQRDAFIKLLIKHGEVNHFESQVRRRDGEIVWLATSARLASVEDDTAQDDRIIDGFVQDITERRKARQWLRESEEKFRSLTESSTDYIMRYDRHHRHTYMNPAALKACGCSEADIIGKTHLEAGFPEDLSRRWEEKIEQVFVTAASSQSEFSWESTHGKVYLDWRLTPEFDAEGRVYSVLGVSRDITERKRLEDVRTFLAHLGAGASDEPFFNALARYLAQNLDMEFVCIDRLEGDGLTARTVASWHDGHFEDNFTYSLLDTPCGEAVGKEICCYPANVRALFPRDQVLQELCAESYIGVTLWGHTGVPIGLVAVIGKAPLENRQLAETILKNVAIRAAGELERMWAEESLRESEALTRTITDSARDAILMMDQHGIISYWNPAAEHIFGYTRSEAIGRNLHELLAPNRYQRSIGNALTEFQHSGKGRAIDTILEMEGCHKDGHEISLELSLSVLRAPEGWQAVGIIRDITDRKRAEDEKRQLQAQLLQSQKLEAIGTLAGGIAHDFNNILAAVIGYADMARENVEPGTTLARDLDQVLNAGERARDLVKQILTFSHQGDTDPINFYPAVVVKEAIKLLRPTLPSTIAIKQNIDPKAGPVCIDPTQMHQILMNLCTNAYHAMEEQGGELEIVLRSADLDALALTSRPESDFIAYIELVIRDNGQGIHPEAIDRIFDPFFTTKGVGKGTGMGLSIVHGIVKSCGGFITVDSSLGRGTAFHVFLPVAANATPANVSADDPVPLGSERILFIDDEEVLTDLAKTMLERLGYLVTVRNNSLEGLTTFQNHPDRFDLVITDQTMPGMTGMDLSRRLLRIRPHLPIILCTGFSALVSEEKAKTIGIRALAHKPLTKKDIASLIRKVLGDR